PPPGGLRSASDTEILLLAWDRWGPDCLDRLIGQWAFAMYERDTRRLWLARDRFGEKPLFYHAGEDALSFASNIGRLLRAGWISREIDPESLAEYLTLRYVVSPRTLLRDVRKVPPGHLLRYERGEHQVRCWWSPHFHRNGNGHGILKRKEAIEAFGGTLVQA